MLKIIKYGIIGVMTTVINIIVDLSLRKIGLHYSFAILLAWFVAVMFAFWGNKNIVFQNKSTSKWQLFAEFMLSRVFTLVVEMLASAVCISIIGLNETIVKVVLTVVIIILNYILGVLIFDKKKNEK